MWTVNISWWRHQMKHFPRYWPFVRGNSSVTGRLPSQRPVTWTLDVFFAMRLNKRWSKQSRRRWFETSWRSLWRHRNITGPTRTVFPYQCKEITEWYSLNQRKQLNGPRLSHLTFFLQENHGRLRVNVTLFVLREDNEIQNIVHCVVINMYIHFVVWNQFNRTAG